MGHNVAEWRRVIFNALIRYSFVIEEGIHFSAVVAMRNIAAKIEQPEFFLPLLIGETRAVMDGHRLRHANFLCLSRVV